MVNKGLIAIANCFIIIIVIIFILTLYFITEAFAMIE
jgi:hypothetical protein